MKNYGDQGGCCPSRPPSCLLAVFPMFLAITSPSSSCSSYS